MKPDPISPMFSVFGISKLPLRPRCDGSLRVCNSFSPESAVGGLLDLRVYLQVNHTSSKLDMATPILILDGADWAGIVLRAVAIMAMTGAENSYDFHFFKGRRNEGALETADF
jgi:hypothetical protein